MDKKISISEPKKSGENPWEIAKLDSQNRANMLKELRASLFADRDLYRHFSTAKILPDLDNAIGFTLMTQADTYMRFQLGSVWWEGRNNPWKIMVMSIGNFSYGKNIAILTPLEREDFIEYTRFVLNLDAMRSKMQKEKKTIHYKLETFTLEDDRWNMLADLNLLVLKKKLIIETLQAFSYVNSTDMPLPSRFEWEKI
jgi:hypothetical protein